MTMNKLPLPIKLLMLAGVLVVSYPILSKPSAPTKPEISDEECVKDLQCWARRHEWAATVACRIEIEKLAKYSTEWTDAWYESKFSKIGFAKDGAAGTLVYGGDKIKFQNGFGAWQPHTYVCKYDPVTKKAFDVFAAPGHLLD